MPDMYLTDRHEQLRHDVRAFALAEVAPRVARMESSGQVEREVAQLIADRGWIGVTVASVYGGLHAGHLAKTLVIEELSRVSGAMGAMAQASQLGAAKIIHFGSREQQQLWLPGVADGSVLPTIAVTEAESGSEVLGMQTTARRRGREYILTGAKVFVGNSHIGTVHGVVARTGRGSGGLTAFLVEADRPGLSLHPHQRALGLHGFSFGTLVLDNCRIPAANRIGEEGHGLSVAYSSSMVYGRPNLTAVSLGLHQAIFDEVTQFVERRQRYQAPLSKLPNIQQKVAQMKSRLMTARLTAYHAAHLLDLGLPCDAELLNAKYVNVEEAITSARAAMEIMAASALQTSHPMERLVRDAFHPFAPAGTSDIQLLRLAEIALGRTRSQWSERFAKASAPSADYNAGSPGRPVPVPA